MAKLVARFRQSGSFVAGIVIGISIIVAMFAVADNRPGRWPTILAFAAPVILLMGIALQARIVSGPRRRLRAAPEARHVKLVVERSSLHPESAGEGAVGLS
jgi:hypothetical protein